MKNVSNRPAIASASLAAILASLPVVAQEPALEEIVVTAQKRAQSAQDVGISIVAFADDELESRRIFDVSQLAEHVPNMEIGDTGDSFIPIFIIRGVGLQDYNANNTPTTAVVVDDVYQPYGVYGKFTLLDAERVEVLRGPQGGLYGRNSTGGAINIVSRAPSFDDLEANGSVDAGNYGTANFRGGVSVPFSDMFAVRLAAQYDSSDGYFRNTYLDRDQGGKDKLQTRLTVSFRPSETFSGDLRLNYGYDKSEVSIPELAGYLDPNTAWEGPLAEFGSPDMNVPFTADGVPVYCPAVLETGIPDASCVTANGFTPDGDPYAGAESKVRSLDDDFRAASLNLNFDLGTVTLLSITSAANMDFFATNGVGAVGIAPSQNPEEWQAYGQLVGRANGGAVDPNYVTDYDTRIDSWSQELRVLSNSEGDLSWMAGVVYAEDQLDENRYCQFPANLYFDYAVFPGCGTMIYAQDTEAWSVYGQVAYDFSAAWRLTVDARYTDEKKTYEGGVWINDGAWTCLLYELDLADCAAEFGYDPSTNLFPLATGAVAKYHEKDPSFKVNLDYMPTDDILLYVSAGQTFKSGGFFGGFFFSPDAIVAYEPETNFAVEVGAKTTLASGRLRLNGAIFHYDYKDFQGNLNAQSETAGGGAVFSGLTNLGDVETLGAEVDLEWLATDGLTLGLGIGVLDTEIKKVADSGFTDPDVVVGVTNIRSEVVDIVGNELNDAPRLSANFLVRYDFTFGGDLDATLQLDSSWTDDYFLSVSNEPYSKEDGVLLVNALARIAFGPERRMAVSVWGRNLSDESYRISTLDDGVFSNYSNWSEPRTYGATFTIQY